MPPEARSLRLFVAVELPEPWREALRRETEALRSVAPGFGRWVDPSLLHVTLVFLGYQLADRLAALTSAMDAAAAASSAFTITPGMPGWFGGRGVVRVVWAGIEDRPHGALGKLRDAVAAELRHAGVSFDERPFAPHVTLARARRDAGPADSAAMQRALTGRSSWGSHLAATDGIAQCREIVLMRSDLRPTGPIYTPLHRSPLG